MGLLLLIPGIIVTRELRRASVRGTAVELSPRQYPELYEAAEDFAVRLRLRRRPRLFLANGNGTLNAFAAQAAGWDYVVLSNELFVNLYNDNRDGLHFILGHELGHIRPHHISLWYQSGQPAAWLLGLAGLSAQVSSVHRSPFTVRRLERLVRIGLLRPDRASTAPTTPGAAGRP